MSGLGTGSSWHVDPLNTSAWNTLVSGTKRWAAYPPAAAPPYTVPFAPAPDWYFPPSPGSPAATTDGIGGSNTTASVSASASPPASASASASPPAAASSSPADKRDANARRAATGQGWWGITAPWSLARPAPLDYFRRILPSRHREHGKDREENDAGGGRRKGANTSTNEHARDGLLQCMQRPGDTVFMPAGWWHTVLNTAATNVAFTHNYAAGAEGGGGLHQVLGELEKRPLGTMPRRCLEQLRHAGHATSSKRVVSTSPSARSSVLSRTAMATSARSAATCNSNPSSNDDSSFANANTTVLARPIGSIGPSGVYSTSVVLRGSATGNEQEYGRKVGGGGGGKEDDIEETGGDDDDEEEARLAAGDAGASIQVLLFLGTLGGIAEARVGRVCTLLADWAVEEERSGQLGQGIAVVMVPATRRNARLRRLFGVASADDNDRGGERPTRVGNGENVQSRPPPTAVSVRALQIGPVLFNFPPPRNVQEALAAFVEHTLSDGSTEAADIDEADQADPADSADSAVEAMVASLKVWVRGIVSGRERPALGDTERRNLMLMRDAERAKER